MYLLPKIFTVLENAWRDKPKERTSNGGLLEFERIKEYSYLKGFTLGKYSSPC